jgi:AraC-like DNA-binding protein
MVEPHREIRTELGWAWHRLVAGGDRRVDRLADEIGWSRGYFARLFAAEFGLQPKETARVVRFDRARRALADGTVSGNAERGSLVADIAARHGYADQAHLSREWRRLAGCTPGEWQREVLAFVQS